MMSNFKKTKEEKDSDCPEPLKTRGMRLWVNQDISICIDVQNI